MLTLLESKVVPYPRQPEWNRPRVVVLPQSPECDSEGSISLPNIRQDDSEAGSHIDTGLDLDLQRPRQALSPVILPRRPGYRFKYRTFTGVATNQA
jgi:hypothetical protein